MKRAILFLALMVVSALAMAGTPTLQSSIKVLSCPAAPSNGTSEVQTITYGGTPNGGGSYVLRFGTQSTAPINWSATNSTLVSNVQTALRALSHIGPTGVNVAVGTMTAGIGTITVTFAGNLAKIDVDQITVPNNTLTGGSPTVVVSTTTPGVTADGRNQAGVGNLLVDRTNGKVYLDTGTASNPTWTLVGPP